MNERGVGFQELENNTKLCWQTHNLLTVDFSGESVRLPTIVYITAGGKKEEIS